MSRSVPLKSYPIHLSKTAQIFDLISYLLLRASLNNAQKDPVITDTLLCVSFSTHYSQTMRS